MCVWVGKLDKLIAHPIVCPTVALKDSEVNVYKWKVLVQRIKLFMQTSSFSLFRIAAEELPCSLIDVLGLIMTQWQWFTSRCNAFRTAALFFILCVSMPKENYINPTSQIACADKDTLYRPSWSKFWIWGALKGQMDWDQGDGIQIKKVSKNRESVFWVLCKVERWSWGTMWAREP